MENGRSEPQFYPMDTYQTETTQMPYSPYPAAMPHSHSYNLQTAYNQGHVHYMRGMTSVDPGGHDQHVHYYNGTTTLSDGHAHRYVGITGPAIPVQGGHVHLLSGNTTFEHRHIHNYGNYTEPSRP